MCINTVQGRDLKPVWHPTVDQGLWEESVAFHTFSHRINTHSRHQSGSGAVMTCTHFTQTHSHTSVKSASGQILKTNADTVT